MLFLKHYLRCMLYSILLGIYFFWFLVVFSCFFECFNFEVSSGGLRSCECALDFCESHFLLKCFNETNNIFYHYFLTKAREWPILT